MKTSLFIALSVSILLGSCNIYNPAEPVPAYIHIDNIKLKGTDTTSSGQGSNSSKISDAWIYIDEQLIGCFQMPCTVPAVASAGNHTLKIKTGIKVNGIAATRSPYPFYTDYIQSINLQPGQTTNVTGASVTYLSLMTGIAHFPMIEDFESTGFNMDSTNFSNAPLLPPVVAPSANVFEGHYSAVGVLHASDGTFECSTNDYYNLNKNSLPVFLEFNYKCNKDFMVYVRGVPSYNTVEALSFNPSENWNKAYLYLTPAISQLYAQSGATTFKIYFLMRNPNGADSLGLALDNIKIVQ